MKVLIAGASGFIGKALASSLVSSGHEVVRLVRREAGQGEIRWRPDDGFVDSAGLDGIDAAVNLAGENIFGRWTKTKKTTILQSRLTATRTLAASLAELKPSPEVLVSMSGVNYYGDRGDEELEEGSGKGMGFLADVCAEWEGATAAAGNAGIRVVNPRMGIVLGRDGGALQKMLLPFKLGIGGKIGSGEQYMSWIAADDAIGAIEFALVTRDLSGPVNFASPYPVRNKDFTRVLANVLNRPAFFTVPAFALRMVMGEAADELLLSSTRVSKSKLSIAGFRFAYPRLEAALRRVL